MCHGTEVINAMSPKNPSKIDDVQKVRTVVYLDKSEREALEKISEKTGAPVAALVRKAIAEWLKKSRA
jgi:hypothetical protein